MKRVIVHPSFINASFSEVEKCLQSMDQGDAVFRPSSKVRLDRSETNFFQLRYDFPLSSFSCKFYSRNVLLSSIQVHSLFVRFYIGLSDKDIFTITIILSLSQYMIVSR